MNTDKLCSEVDDIEVAVDTMVLKGHALSKAELEALQRKLFIAVRDLTGAAVKLYTLIRHAS